MKLKTFKEILKMNPELAGLSEEKVMELIENQETLRSFNVDANRVALMPGNAIVPKTWIVE
jgi:hypothetical protein